MKMLNLSNNYMLFIYAGHPEPSKLYLSIQSMMSEVISDEISYIHSDDSALFTFSTALDMLDLYEILDEILCSDDVTYLLIPIDLGNMVIKSSDDMYEHLFGRFKSKMTSVDEKTNDIALDQLKRMEEFLNTIDYDEQDEDLLVKLRNKKVEPTLDDLLDKIVDSGMDSLTTEDRKLLETYSKQS